MQLRINGDNVDIPNTIATVYDLLVHFGLDKKIVVVELNGDILARAAHDTSTVQPGDRVEIVNFVGGG